VPHTPEGAITPEGYSCFFLDGTPPAGIDLPALNVDTTKTTTHLGLCAGYGGIELGLKRVLPALRTVALCEIEAFACANLVAKMEAGLMDPAPIWTDLKTFPWEAFRDRVDVLTGGYPCQPFSAAGKRLGAEDPRHLWPYIAAGIAAMRPRVCFFENVEGHISLGLREVIEELEGLGYRTAWGIFSAAEVGAPHQRKRVFILAQRSGEGLQGLREKCGHAESCKKVQAGRSGIHVWPSRPGEPQHEWEPPRVVGHTEDKRRGGLDDESGQVGGGETRGYTDGPSATEQQDQRQTESPLGRDADGPAGRLDYAELCVSCDNRTDELRLLGNGVVPATAERAFRVLLEELL
jgi:DNA (cytosine-5)-methyltransferase 1